MLRIAVEKGGGGGWTRVSEEARFEAELKVHERQIADLQQEQAVHHKLTQTALLARSL